MSYLDWKVGDKVVCVVVNEVNLIRNGWRKWLPKQRLSHHLQIGEVYTIRGLTIHHDHDRGDVVCVFLAGFGFKESSKVAFPAVWFRPVQTKATDISALQALLLNPFVKIGEDA